MIDYDLIRFLHLLGFAYWIGGDLAVFYTSYYVTDDSLSAESRTTAARIVFAVDQVSRVCMTLMLPLGLHLAWRLNLLPLNLPLVALIWLTCFAWLTMVLALHFWNSQAPAKHLLARVDFAFRILLAVALLGAGLAGIVGLYGVPYWIAWKLLIFGGLVCLGLLVRRCLKPFGPAFAKLASNQVTPADNAAIRKSLGGTRPLVTLIWIGLFASAAFGRHLF